MLYVLAIRHFGATGAAMISRPATANTLVRVGASSSDDLRLGGASGPGADLFFDGAAWLVRLPEGVVRRACDGDHFTLGPWMVVLIGVDDQSASLVDVEPAAHAADAPHFECDGAVLPLAGFEPRLVGAAPWSAVRFEALELGVVAVARRLADGGTLLYPLPSVATHVNDARVRQPTRLSSGDAIAFGRPGRGRLLYFDPGEEMDRLLGTLRGEPEPAPREKPRNPPTATRVEAGLWAAGLAITLAYIVIAFVRW